MKFLYKFFKESPYGFLRLIGTVVTPFLISQFQWAYRHGNYNDLLPRLLLGLFIGTIFSICYFWLLIKIISKFKLQIDSNSIKKIFVIHSPLYLLWVYHFYKFNIFKLALNSVLICFVIAGLIHIFKKFMFVLVGLSSLIKYSSYRQLITVLMFLIMIFLPAVEQKVRLFPVLESTEKRQMASKPQFSWGTIADFPKKYEIYFNDNFGLRDMLIKLNNLIKIEYLQTSLPHVIIGKEDWLFYDSEKKMDGISISDYRGLSPYTKQELEKIKDNIEDQTRWLNEKGIKSIILICPNKETIYPEFLPDTIKRVQNQTRLDQLTNYLEENCSYQILDIRKQLTEAKKSYPVYHKTDTHWNQIGGFIAYQEIMKQLSSVLPIRTILSLSDYDITIVNRGGEGDLAVMLSSRGKFQDHFVTLIPKNKNTQKNLSKAMLIHDSFAIEIRPFLENSFNLVTYPHNGSFLDHIELIESEKPDFVIFEYVERYQDALGK